MPKRILRKITSPTARTIGALWFVVALVSGLVIHSSIQDANCAKQFRAALVARSNASEQADRLASQQDMAQLQWLDELAHPPSEVANDYGPARTEWLKGVTANAAARIQQLLDARAKVAQERADHPYPEVTCGK